MIKKQLRRTNEKKKLEPLEKKDLDANISEISSSLNNFNEPLQTDRQLDASPAESQEKISENNKKQVSTETRHHSKIRPVTQPQVQPQGNGKKMERPSSGQAKGRNLGTNRGTELSKKDCVLAEQFEAYWKKDNFNNSEGGIVKLKKLFKMLNLTVENCAECNKKRTFDGVIKSNLNKKYLTSRDSYNTKVISDIIYNENTHIVSLFKDFLIYDDISEFLKRYYLGKETTTRLPKIYDFYDKYSKVFPNFVILEEKKFMFKNISRKQRVIDEQQKQAVVAEEKKQKLNLGDSNETSKKIFTNSIMKNINKSDTIFDLSNLNEQNDSNISSQLGTYIKNQPKGDIDKSQEFTKDLSLRDLVDKFIQKDSKSYIDINAILKDFDNQHPSAPKPNANLKLVEHKNAQKVIIEKPLSDGRVIHLRGKSNEIQNSTNTNQVKPASIKPNIKQIPDIKSLQIKIEQINIPAKKEPVEILVHEKMIKPAVLAKTDLTKSIKSRNPKGQSTNTELKISGAKPIQLPNEKNLHTVTSTSKLSNAGKANSPTKSEMRSHSQGAIQRTGPAPVKPAQIKPAILSKNKSPMKPVPVKTKSSRNEKFSSETHEPKSARTSSLDTNSRTNITNKSIKTEHSRSSSTKPDSKNKAQIPLKATPTKGMPSNISQPKSTKQNTVLGLQNHKSMPLSARNIYNSTPTKMTIQVQSPALPRPASSTGLHKTNRTPLEYQSKNHPAKLNGINVLKIDIDSLAKKIPKEIKRPTPGVPPPKHAEAGKKFRSDYLNALSSKQNNNGSEENKKNSQKQVSTADQLKNSTGAIIGPNLNYSKSVEALEKNNKEDPKIKPKQPELTKNDIKYNFSNTKEQKGAYYQQFMKNGTSK